MKFECRILVDVLREGEKTVPVLLCLPEIHHIVAWVVREISAVYCEDDRKRAHCTGNVQYRVFLMLKQLVRIIAMMLVRFKCLEIRHDILKIVSVRIIVEFMRN
jgi:hypothetical protein